MIEMTIVFSIKWVVDIKLKISKKSTLRETLF